MNLNTPHNPACGNCGRVMTAPVCECRGESRPAGSHTPTPWELHPGDPSVIRAAVVGAQRCTAAVAVVRYGLRSNAEAEANAELIVRAVNCHADLLAALRRIVDIRNGPHEHKALGKCQEMYEVAFAAVAKAEGQL